MWKSRSVCVSGLWVAFGCVDAKYVIEMNMIHRTYLGCWLSGVRCRAAGCASRKTDVARLALSSGIGWEGGEWPFGTGGSGRLRIVQE